MAHPPRHTMATPHCMPACTGRRLPSGCCSISNWTMVPATKGWNDAAKLHAVRGADRRAAGAGLADGHLGHGRCALPTIRRRLSRARLSAPITTPLSQGPAAERAPATLAVPVRSPIPTVSVMNLMTRVVGTIATKSYTLDQCNTRPRSTDLSTSVFEDSPRCGNSAGCEKFDPIVGIVLAIFRKS